MSLSNGNYRVVLLPHGPIKGEKRQTIYGHDYYSFEGIPYAKPPLGELRFKAPQRILDNWTEVRDCTKCGSKPMQKNLLTGNIEGSEDCLYLNVYTKTFESERHLPVMVFIYGGCFSMGEATPELYGPDYFMHENVVLVIINYRLDSLGFLSLSDRKLLVPGNAGLRDQILALRWVKQYIKHFNGEYVNITLLGESAGGACIHWLMLAEQTRDLFHRAILMSGCALNNWASAPHSNMAYRLAEYHGYKGDKADRHVLEFLSKLEPEKLVDHQLIRADERHNDRLFAFVPVVEPYSTEDSVIEKPVYDLLQKSWSNNIPLMIGGTSFEGLFMYPYLKNSPQIIEELQSAPELLLPEEIRAMHTEDDCKKLGQRIMRAHFGEKVISEETKMDLLDLYSCKLFWHGLHRTVLARLAYSKSVTYMYRFDFDSPDFNHYRKLFCGTDVVRGVAHGDDLSYLFFHKYAWKVEADSAEYKTIEHMVSLWTNFAKQSNPNSSDTSLNHWKPLRKIHPFSALNISAELKMMDLPEMAKLESWNALDRLESVTLSNRENSIP